MGARNASLRDAEFLLVIGDDPAPSEPTEFARKVQEFKARRFERFLALRHARMVRLVSRMGYSYVIHRTCSGERERWRVTYFDENMQPNGHRVFCSRAAAFREFEAGRTIEVIA
jgi:hypothetical protein